jgi:CBS domain containing-hemolysin-like protein
MTVTSRPTAVWAFLDESRQDALNKTARINVKEFPVVREKAIYDIIGLIAKRDIISPLPLTQLPPAFLYYQLMADNVQNSWDSRYGDR